MRTRNARARAKNDSVLHSYSCIIREEGGGAFLRLLSWAERNSGRYEHRRVRDDCTAFP
jgi:hypothetical protein